MVSKIKRIRVINILKNVYDTYIRKNHDYGEAFDNLMDEDGPIYLKGKLTEKLFRFKTLINNKPKVKESLQDTLYDIIGYCILGLLWYETHEAVFKKRSGKDSQK